MPEITRFYGLIIRMFYKEHNPPHIHIEYGEKKGIIDIRAGTMTDGDLPPKALVLAKEWTSAYKEELLDMWEDQKIRRLPPLE